MIKTETRREVWADEQGNLCFRIHPNALDRALIEIGCIETGIVGATMTMAPAVAREIADCLLRAAAEAESA